MKRIKKLPINNNEKNKTEIKNLGHEIKSGEFKQISLRGIITPDDYLKRADSYTGYRLLCINGESFSIHGNKQWIEVLENFRWYEVRAKGVVELKRNILIPSMIVPMFPDENRAPVIEPSFKEKTYDFIKNIWQNGSRPLCQPS